MKILVTGCAGLIGSHLCRWINTQTKHTAIGLDDLSCGDPANIHGPWIRCTLGEGYVTSILQKMKPSVVFHCAAYAAEGLSPFIRRHNYINNLVGTAELVSASIAAGVLRFVFFSSMAVYGQRRVPYHEDDETTPIDPYGNAKLAAEHDIQIAGKHHGLPWTIIRPHNVFGEGQVCTQRFRNVIGIWMNQAFHGAHLTVFGTGTQRRAFSYIEDCVQPFYEAGIRKETENEIINVGGRKPLAIQDAAEIVGSVTGQRRIQYLSGRYEVHDAWCSVKKSVKLLDYKENYDFADGVRRMWKWFQTHDHPKIEHPSIELTAGLPPYWNDEM